MAPWTLVESNPTLGRMFQRPLGPLEHGFFWNGLFGGTADEIQHVELHLPNGARDAHLFSDANIVKAWLSTKRRYPLAGAIVQGKERGRFGVPADSKADEAGMDGRGFTPEFHFVVREHALSSLRRGEIVFEQVASAEEARHRIVSILNGPHSLSPELLAQLYVLREVNSVKPRSDVLHLGLLMAHCVADGMAMWTFMRCLVDTLSRGGESDTVPAQIPLEDRLAAAISEGELEPAHLRMMNPARRRWRKAAAAVIQQLRSGKLQGGHTLPCCLTRSTWRTPARSCYITTVLTRAQSAAVIANCRQHNLTFGIAYLVLAQVAMTRVLYRRYLRGDMSEEEWAYRKRQPYINAAPINLRPHLDKTWFQKSGGGEFVLSIGFLLTQLPFMTLGGTEGGKFGGPKHDMEPALSDSAPPLSDLLSFDRFLHRAALIKKQMATFFNHPLFYEIVQADLAKFVEYQRFCALQWMERVEKGGRDGANVNENEVLAVPDFPMTWAHGGCSFGNVDSIFPSEYPLPPTHPLSPYSPVSHPMKAGYTVPSSLRGSQIDDKMRPKVVVEHNSSLVHMRPGELYLGGGTWCGQLHIPVYYDGDVFEEEVIREWSDEVKGAVLWYLGGDADDAVGRDRCVRAKL